MNKKNLNMNTKMSISCLSLSSKIVLISFFLITLLHFLIFYIVYILGGQYLLKKNLK